MTDEEDTFPLPIWILAALVAMAGRTIPTDETEAEAYEAARWTLTQLENGDAP